MRNDHMLAAAMTIFMLFFGFSLLDAVKFGNWPAAVFWLVVGALFFWLGLRNRRRRLH